MGDFVQISDDSDMEADKAPAYTLCLDDSNWLDDEVRNESDDKILGKIKFHAFAHIGCKYGTVPS
jgi:hypothetical protein